MKKFNKLRYAVTALLVFACICSFNIFTASAEENTVTGGTWGGIDWTFEVTDSQNGTGRLTIAPTQGTPETNPRTGQPYEVGQWREAVRYENGSAKAIISPPYDPEKVTELIIEEGVTTIGSFVAQRMPATGELRIPSTVTYVGQETFSHAGFTSLVFAEGSQLTCVAAGAFKYIPVTSVILPEGLVCLHAWAFEGCEELTTVYIPSTLQTMSGVAHYDYSPSYAASGSGIFSGAIKLNSITFGSQAVKDRFMTDGYIGVYSSNTRKNAPTTKATSGLTAFTDIQSGLDFAAQGNGTLTLTRSVDLSAGSELVIPEGVSLVIPQGITLTNNGEIVNLGLIDGEGTLENNSIYARTSPDSTASTLTLSGSGSEFRIYNITCDIGPGAAVSGNPTYYHEKTPDFTLVPPERLGYTFKGWSGTGLVGDDNMTVTVPLGSSGDRSYAANWTANQYTITFDSNGGSSVDPITADYATALTPPAAPTKHGYAFVGWYPAFPATVPAENLTLTAQWASIVYELAVEPSEGGSVKTNFVFAAAGNIAKLTVTPDEGCALESISAVDAGGKAVALTIKDGKYTFEMPTSKVTVKAVFAKTDVLDGFDDIDPKAWYADGLRYFVEKGIVNGTPEGKLLPNAEISRAEAVVMLWRMAGCPETEADNPFSDVAEGLWYTDAVIWGAEKGIVLGSNGKFLPTEKVDLEQFACFLSRFAENVLGRTVESDGSSLAAFDDRDTVSSWAVTSLAWAVDNDFIIGDGNGGLAPKGPTSRARITTILYRYVPGEK